MNLHPFIALAMNDVPGKLRWGWNLLFFVLDVLQSRYVDGFNDLVDVTCGTETVYKCQG